MSVITVKRLARLQIDISIMRVREKLDSVLIMIKVLRMVRCFMSMDAEWSNRYVSGVNHRAMGRDSPRIIVVHWQIMWCDDCVMHWSNIVH
jgi:hypothetical protein